MAARPAALIVEDQPFVGMVASDILRESGFDTFHAHDAQGAVGLLAEHPEIEVMVAEAQLSGSMNGIALCQRVSKERPDVQLVVTFSGAQTPSAGVPGGARLLHKPFATGELRTLVAAKSLLQDA